MLKRNYQRELCGNRMRRSRTKQYGRVLRFAYRSAEAYRRCHRPFVREFAKNKPRLFFGQILSFSKLIDINRHKKTRGHHDEQLQV